MGTQASVIIDRLGGCWLIQPLLQPLKRDKFIGLWGRKHGKQPMYFYSFLTTWYIHFHQKTMQTLKLAESEESLFREDAWWVWHKAPFNYPSSEFEQLCTIGMSLYGALWDRLVLLTTFYKRGVHREKCLAWQHSRASIRTPMTGVYKPHSTLACKSHNVSPCVYFINDFHKYFLSIGDIHLEIKIRSLSSKLESNLISYNHTFISPFQPLNFFFIQDDTDID